MEDYQTHWYGVSVVLSVFISHNKRLDILIPSLPWLSYYCNTKYFKRIEKGLLTFVNGKLIPYLMTPIFFRNQRCVYPLTWVSNY
jgi:hypothetical protein